jgi:hypothetical protein
MVGGTVENRYMAVSFAASRIPNVDALVNRIVARRKIKLPSP